MQRRKLVETRRGFLGRTREATLFVCMQPKPQVGITGKARETLARILDHVLEEECSLAATTRAYRSQLTGPNLYSLCRLFDEQRRQLDGWLDRVADLTKAIGFNKGRPEAAADRTAEAYSGAGLPPRTVVEDLLLRHEAMAYHLRSDIERLRDPATESVLVGLAEFHETTAWMLRMLRDGPELNRPT